MTVLSIQADLNNAVSTCSVISKPSYPFTNPLLAVPRAQITSGIIVIFMFLSFFRLPSNVVVLIPLFSFFQLCSVVRRDSKVQVVVVAVVAAVVLVSSILTVELKQSIFVDWLKVYVWLPIDYVRHIKRAELYNDRNFLTKNNIRTEHLYDF